MVRLRKLFIDFSPVLGYLISLIQYYYYSLLVTYLIETSSPWLKILGLLIIFVGIPAIGYSGKEFIGFLNIETAYDKFRCALRLVISPYHNSYRFLRWLATLCIISYQGFTAPNMELHFERFFNHLEYPFKQSKNLF